MKKQLFLPLVSKTKYLPILNRPKKIKNYNYEILDYSQFLLNHNTHLLFLENESNKYKDIFYVSIKKN